MRDDNKQNSRWRWTKTKPGKRVVTDPYEYRVAVETPAASYRLRTPAANGYRNIPGGKRHATLVRLDPKSDGWLALFRCEHEVLIRRFPEMDAGLDDEFCWFPGW